MLLDVHSADGTAFVCCEPLIHTHNVKQVHAGKAPEKKNNSLFEMPNVPAILFSKCLRLQVGKFYSLVSFLNVTFNKLKQIKGGGGS